MQIDIKNINGESTGKQADLPDEIFGIEPNEHVVYLAVKQHLANRRQGTHKAKERGEITGSTKKLKRQKGTGTARAGSIKSPIFRGGGRIFGPRPRTYDQKLNKKVKVLARKSALSGKVQNEEIMVLEDFTFDVPSTKAYVDILNKLELNNAKTLLVLSENDDNIYLSSRNIPKANVKLASDLSTYDILNNKCLILSESAIEKITETLS